MFIIINLIISYININPVFLSNYSTVHQLLEICDCNPNSLDKKEFSCFVFCDFSKAFDKVWYKGSIHYMKAYGFKGRLIQFSENYRYERKQKVVLNKSSLLPCKVSVVVLQGLVLGPLFFVFLLYLLKVSLVILYHCADFLLMIRLSSILDRIVTR